MPIYKMDGKKDGLQKYRVRINYTDKDGKQKQLDRVAYGKEEAKELERQLNHNLHEETANRITVKELYDEYISVKKHEVRESSLHNIIKWSERYVLPQLGSYKLTKLNAPVLQKWKQHINECANEKKPAEKLSHSTKKNIYKELRALLNYAVKMEYIPKNPLVSVGNFKSAMEFEKEMNFYTVQEFKKFIVSSKKQAELSEKSTGAITEWNYYVFFNIAFFTGMRKGEINALKWTDIENDVVHVRRSIAQKLKGDDRETPPKNKSSIRDLKLPKPLIRVLAEHKSRWEQMDGFTENYRICGGETCLRDTTIQNRNERYSKLADLKTIRIHDFRHSHASFLANQGINIQEIARRLGHSNIETTWNIYAHLYPHEEEKAVNILNEIEI